MPTFRFRQKDIDALHELAERGLILAEVVNRYRIHRMLKDKEKAWEIAKEVLERKDALQVESEE
jgi:hypothetical protein